MFGAPFIGGTLTFACFGPNFHSPHEVHGFRPEGNADVFEAVASVGEILRCATIYGVRALPCHISQIVILTQIAA